MSMQAQRCLVHGERVRLLGIALVVKMFRSSLRQPPQRHALTLRGLWFAALCSRGAVVVCRSFANNGWGCVLLLGSWAMSVCDTVSKRPWS